MTRRGARSPAAGRPRDSGAGAASPSGAKMRAIRCMRASASPLSPPGAASTCRMRASALRRTSMSSGSNAGKRRYRGLRIDQQHEELIAHERLELRKRQGRKVFLVAADAPHRLEAALIDPGAPHADIDAAREWSLRECRPPECGPSDRPSAARPVHDKARSSALSGKVRSRTDRFRTRPAPRANRRRQERSVRTRPSRRSRKASSAETIWREKLLLRRQEGIVGAHRLAMLAHPAGENGKHRRERVRVRHQLILQAHRMQAMHRGPPSARSRMRARTAARRFDTARDWPPTSGRRSRIGDRPQYRFRRARGYRRACAPRSA